MNPQEKAYQEQINKLKARLSLQATSKAIESFKPQCEALGIDAVQFVKVTASLPSGAKAFCEDVISKASATLSHVKQQSAAQLLEAQANVLKARTAAQYAIDAATKMELSDD
ncbi:hypothetical protein AU509_03005 [Lonsdalea britannica]|uniref:Uncharacterized protein n=1 Tax=Lonsdalea britannica TaxID=1082704 RepID=A0AAD0WLC7_9GAMM|nr:hypothetical protein [Lonsdalea britannica]AXW87273.1 hypothetical protein CKQ53_09945 [Lonsdalea britannica]OSM99793.1 hypothetical protein AU509_03005 [Lonsdalea britannica]